MIEVNRDNLTLDLDLTTKGVKTSACDIHKALHIDRQLLSYIYTDSRAIKN